ncbi:hypothetical protein BC939DRAFT_502373 [Gamsiella multidivaricata]|uniref:uncharacterized protein n=1 Tax=Gamsiella multidivaricata TaxID=101098 RepID=UPI0022202DBE|nr:uncharacterized protein BC939DRAFT_502373 [Gamsiella multidivaricata]KAG0369229.1 hypothetical protein BGZ54_010516 [Gamsiella multidivaricata]KAI7825132.1 hypothetical protein BC939DRAFT_502373 [Gamsiella multidivaricata]
MRTADLINLLRSQDRSKSSTKVCLTSLEPARRLHLLGELSNWLLVELQKYHDRQAGPAALETLQQGSIRSQIRHTLLAIQVVLDTSDNINGSGDGRNQNSNVTNGGSSDALIATISHSTSPPDPQSTSAKAALLLDDKHKEKILESLLRPILIGIAPLGPRVDSTDVQLLCAKILCHCTNPLTKDAPFPPETLFRKMMTLCLATTQGQQPTKLDQDRSKTPLMVDATQGLAALLNSPLIKLQEYGLRILTSHRFLAQMNQAWELLASLQPVLKALGNNLRLLTGEKSLDLSDQGSDTSDANNQHSGEGGHHGGTNGGLTRGLSKDLEVAIGTRSKALTLLQWFLQEAGKPPPASSIPSSSSAKLSKLKEATDMSLLVDLWGSVQHIVLFGRVLVPAGERLVLVISACIYWWCWIFQHDAMAYMMNTAPDTLMAWYGYYIIPRDRMPAPVSSSTFSLQPSMSSKSDSDRITDNIRQQSYILEYLSKLIQNIVTPKKYHATLFVGNPPIGVVIMRRTIEFLEGILESTLPLTDQGSNLDQAASPPFTHDDDPLLVRKRPASYSIRIIQERPGVLEAMLRIMVACSGGSREGDSLVLNSRLLDVLVLLLSDIQGLFAIQHLAETTARKIRHLALNLLQWILNRDSPLPALEDVTMDHWTLGYTALVDSIMIPLEQQFDAGSTSEHQYSEKTLDDDMGVKALKVFRLFWKHHIRGHSLLSDLLGPRLHQLRMIPILLLNSTMDVTGRRSSNAKWVKERILLLLDSVVYFGTESSVRINMRERWPSMPFLVAILGASLKSLESNKYSASDTLSLMVAQKCFAALHNFWYDRLGLVQAIELNVSLSEVGLWNSLMPSAVASGSHSNLSTPSIVPLLLVILAPPETEWSMDLMLNSGKTNRGRGRRIRHLLFERHDPLLVEAALVLAQLSQFQECQQRLITMPGAIWMLTRMMVERSLVGNVGGGASNGDISSFVDGEREVLEKTLFEGLMRVMSAVDLAKSLVSNNTFTEFFAAVLEADLPLHFYNAKMSFEASASNGTSLTAEGPAIGELKIAVDSDRVNKPADRILPTPRQHNFHQQLIQHFRTVMTPLRDQFERIYQYVGGHRSLQDANDTADTVFWMREYCALVFLYTLEPPGPNSSMAWGSRIDKTALLNSESVFGVVCRMLTLEMEYDLVDADQQAAGMEGSEQNEANMSAQKEEAMLRRFSAGLAIQSLSWKHVDHWRQQHQELLRTYDSITTTEWGRHTVTLRGNDGPELGSSTGPIPVSFMVEERVLIFPDRLALSRASSFFHTLLVGDFKEASEQHIRIQDVDPDDFEMLLEVLRESRMTVRLLLPEDLPFDLVLRLMVCAERFMVTFVKRLSEHWILQALGTRELKWYNLMRSTSPRSESRGLPEDAGQKAKHDRDETLEESQEKRQRLDTKAEEQKVDIRSEEPHETQKQGVDRGPKTDIGNELAVPNLQQQQQQQQEQSDMDPVQDDSNDDEESIQECLLMVYETCSSPHYGSIYFSEHPFHGLVWDALKRTVLRLGSVAITPRFATMLDKGGEERIEDLLQILYELVVDSVP